MTFTDLELALEEAEFLQEHDVQTYYLVHDGQYYQLITADQRASPEFRNLPLLEKFNSPYLDV